MKLVVVIPTIGRKDLVNRVIGYLEGQTRLPDEVLVSAPDDSHVAPFVSDKFKVSYVFGKKGLCAQRNQALEQVLGRFDIISFFDDDFLPARHYLERLVRAFEERPDWAVIMGHAVADGAHNEGLTFEQGVAILEEAEARDYGEPVITDHVGAYGCNMSMRAAVIGETRFDERLPLYGWQEDIDFTSQLRRHGKVVGLSILPGVHLGAKSGRVSGVRLGYSQVVNPIYLVKKGTVPASFAYELMGRNVIANIVRSFWPERYIDRWGRLKGNLLAASHVIRGKVNPEHILHL
jgi:GT2 family glycosyltransferase